jgi:LysM repeat protein
LGWGIGPSFVYQKDHAHSRLKNQTLSSFSVIQILSQQPLPPPKEESGRRSVMEIRRTDRSKPQPATPDEVGQTRAGQTTSNQQTPDVSDVSEAVGSNKAPGQTAAGKALLQGASLTKANARFAGSVAGVSIDRQVAAKVEEMRQSNAAKAETGHASNRLTRPSGRKHTVAEGETLPEIADRHGTTLLALIAVNRGVNFADLQPGQQIELPEARKKSPPPVAEQDGAAALQQLQQAASTLPPGRKLDPSEIANLQKIFGKSVDYSKVEIVEGNLGALGALSQGRAFTVGNTIYVPGVPLAQRPKPAGEALLAHEAVHVWQFQSSGAGYIPSSIWARATQGEQAAYSWRKDVDSGKAWHELNSEQQGQLIEDAFKAGFFNNPGSTFSLGGTDYTRYLNTALRHIARGEGAP